MKKWMLIFALNLISCSTHQPLNGTAIDDMTVELHQDLAKNQAIPEGRRQNSQRDISNALMPDIKFRHPQRLDPREKRFDIAVKDVPARTFYMGLVTGTSISLVVSPEIQGNITLNLKQVTIEQVLQALEDTYNYTYNPIPGGYEVLPNSLRTQIYAVNYLELQRNGNSEMRLHSGEVTDVVTPQGQGSPGGTSNMGTPGGQGLAGGMGAALSGGSSGNSNAAGGNSAPSQGNIGRVRTDSNIDFWRELQYTLKDMIGKEKDRSVTVNPLAGVVVVRAFPKELKQVEAYLDLVQNSVNRQVILEVKVLEVTLNHQYQMGIDWQAYGAQLNALNDFPGTNILMANFPDAYTARVRWFGNFSTIVRLLENQGNVQVLSSPRVSAMNNQQSMIKVGNDEFFVSGIAAGQATLGVAAQATQQITPFFSGITLDVTPQIDVNGDVTLHVHPSVSLVTEQIKMINSGQGPQPTPLAHSTIRESDTVVHAKNGQVVIIGGLMQNQTTEDIAQLPFFGNVPFLGTLVRSTNQNSQKSELVILIKPTVINKSTANRDIKNSMDRMAGLKEGFHVGSRPDVFGTEGEEPIRLGPQAGRYVLPPAPRCRRGARCVLGVAERQAPMKE